MAKGNNFEFGGSNAGGGMTPVEALAAKGVCAKTKGFKSLTEKTGRGKRSQCRKRE